MKGKKKTMPKNDLPEEAPIPFEKVPSPSVSDSDSDYEDSSADDDESSVSLDSLSESELEDASPENGSSGDLEAAETESLEAAETESSLDEDIVNGEGSGSEGSDLHQQGAESDSSEDEVAPRNTIGDVPLKWYADEPHIGYDIKGKKIKKKEKQDKLDSFLANVDDSKNWRKIYDEYNDEVVELTKDEIKLVRRLLKNQAPHSDFDPYPDYVDWYKWEDSKHPLSNAPEPKRRFIPSKWEAKKVVEYVRAIRKGTITFDKPKEEDGPYLLWGDDSGSTEKSNHLAYIPAPKQKLPGHDESYNPPLEYIPTQEEINSYQLMFEEDRPKFIPKRFTSMRSIPAYENAMKESFERCLDLYLCPRVRKKRLNIDPEALKPKLPSRKELKPYPTTCYIEYKGHEDAVTSISVEASGQWMASGSSDGTVRVWEVETGRCLREWDVGEAVSCVSWNPLPDMHILAVSVGQDVLLLNTCLGDEELQNRIKELLWIDSSTASDDSGDKAPSVSWLKDDKHMGLRESVMAALCSLSTASGRPRRLYCVLLSLVAIQVCFSSASVVPLDPQLDSNVDTIWAISRDQIVLDSAQFKTQVLDSVPDLVPADVKCDKIKHCDKNNVCAIVCKHGSVQVDPWLTKALKLQRKLAYRRNFCSATLPGTHNSAINLADGYGVEDHVFEGYLRYFSWFKKGMKVHTNDQLFSLTDQLHMGVRFIELDVHWFNGDLHIAHCGGFKSKLLDGMIEVFNEIAKMLGTGIEWDSSTIGCKPSLSSIPSKEQRPLKEALAELSTWLHAPEHKDEFLIVFFDDEMDLMKWKKVGKLLDYLKEYFPEEEILRPIELAYTTKWPTINELLHVGKRIVFMSGVDYLTDGEELLFVKDTVCNWQEPLLPLAPFPECRFNESKTQIGIPDENFTVFRPETSEIEYGFLNADGQIGTNKNLLNEETLPGVAQCGVNIPSPDNITPKRMEATIWAVPKGHELDPNKCVALMRDSKIWKSVDCQSPNMVPACVDVTNPRHWQLGSASVVEADAAAACAALSSTMKYSASTSGYENGLVYAQLLEHAHSSVAGVWLNARSFVSEVYSTEPNQAVSKVSAIDDIISVE